MLSSMVSWLTENPRSTKLLCKYAKNSQTQTEHISHEKKTVCPSFSDTSHQTISKRFNLPEVHPLLPVETVPCSVMKSIHPCFGQNVSIRPLHEIWVKVVSFSNAFSTIPIQHSNIHLTHLHLRIEALIKRNSTKRSCINVIYQLLL